MGETIGKADELPVHNSKGVGNQTNRGRVHLVIRLLAKVTTKFGGGGAGDGRVMTEMRGGQPQRPSAIIG